MAKISSELYRRMEDCYYDSLDAEFALKKAYRGRYQSHEVRYTIENLQYRQKQLIRDYLGKYGF